jgi:hypothetical protein
MSTQNSQQSLYAGHDVTKTAGTRRYLFIKLVRTYSITQSMRQIYLVFLNQVVYTRLNNPTNDIGTTP